MKKSIWYFALGLILVVVAIEYDVARRSHQQVISKNVSRISAKLAQSETRPSVLPVTNQKSAFEQKFQQATAEVSQLQVNPEETEKKLQDLAGQLSSNDIKKLSQVMLDTTENGDQRAMAVELLSRRQNVESLKQLENFVQQHEANAKWSRSREFESVLRAQAIEGIASYPEKNLAISALTNLDPKLDESFLKDRIKRSIAGLKNGNKASDQRDQEALSKLVE